MASSTPAALTPGQRLWRLLGSERRHIAYLYVYAALTGLVSLTLPLGVQSVIGFVSSGAVSTSLVCWSASSWRARCWWAACR